MDPDEVYRHMMAAVKELNENPGDMDAFIRCSAAIAEDIEALDEWIKNGGFLPAPWRV